MVKKNISLGLILLSLLLPLTEWFASSSLATNNVFTEQPQEEFNPALFRIQNSESLIDYIDSLYGSPSIAVTDTIHYVNLVSRFIRERFYHGYSYFSPGFNTIGWALAPLIKSDLAATVIPNDILKFPNAACSQQSIVFMDVLKQKKIGYRKVGFYQAGVGGHFANEVWYGNEWHYYDVNKEPKAEILMALNRPSIAQILATPGLIDSVYADKMNIQPAVFFQNPFYGVENENPAPRASIYQHGTSFLSYTLPAWLLLLFWQIGWIKKKKPAKAG